LKNEQSVNADILLTHPSAAGAVYDRAYFLDSRKTARSQTAPTERCVKYIDALFEERKGRGLEAATTFFRRSRSHPFISA